MVTYLFALIALIWASLRRAKRPLVIESAICARLLIPALLTLITTFGAQEWMIGLAAQNQTPAEPWQHLLPFPVLDDRQPYGAHTPAWLSDAMLSFAILESCALVVVFASLSRGNLTNRQRAWLTVSASSIVAIALCAPALTSFDLYAYVGSAIEGAHAYNPPMTRLTGDYAAINLIYGVPIYPSAYGPAWLALSQLLALPHGLTASTLVGRAIGCVSFFLCLTALRAARVSSSCLWLFALNPALADLCVCNAHNDGMPLACTLGAFALVARSKNRLSIAAAIILGIIAGAAKLPFVLFGALAFARRATLPQRMIPACIVAVGALCATAIFAGPAYSSALAKTFMLYPQARGGLDIQDHALLAALATSLIVLALAVRRRLTGGAISMIALGSSLFPWYALWALPYALVVEDTLPLYLTALPVFALLLTTVYTPTNARLLFSDLLLVALAALALRTARLRRAVFNGLTGSSAHDRALAAHPIQE